MLEGVNRQEEIDMLVDTGATLSTIPEDLAQRLGVPRLKPKRAQLADGRELVVEAGTVQIKINGREAPTTVLIMGNEPLLEKEAREKQGGRSKGTFILLPGGVKGMVLKGFNWKFCEEKGLKYQATPGFEP